MNDQTTENRVDSAGVTSSATPNASHDAGRGGRAVQAERAGGAGRLDAADDAWPVRPWILAAICALAGLAFYLLAEADGSAAVRAAARGSAAFVAVASLSFALGVERRRWHWALSFSLFWGAVIGLIMWQISAYSYQGDFSGWPILSGLLAVLIATPFFQARRDVAENGRHWRLWQLPYARLHDHGWTDAVIGTAGVVFSGITLLLVLLIGGMFGLIGIRFIGKLMEEGWFILTLAGAGFGGAVGLLRERDHLVSVLQRLAMVVLSVLAPVMAAATLLFLLSLIGTGLAPLWESGFSAAVVMLLAGAAAVLLANAVIGNAETEAMSSRVLRAAAAALVAMVAPLSVIAAAAMALRISQYGWTPERLWGAVAVLVALAYGAAGLWAVVRGRNGFAEALRPLQQRLAIAVILLASFLALPILDFGAISARSQLARLESGRVTVKDFDWTAMAFEYGPGGRDALTRLSASQNSELAKSAKAALMVKDRWQAANDVRAATAAPLEQRLRILPEGAEVPDGARAQLGRLRLCDAAYMCAVYVVNDAHVILLSQHQAGEGIMQQELVRNAAGAWGNPHENDGMGDGRTMPDLKTAVIRLESVEKQRLTVDGRAQELFR